MIDPEDFKQAMSNVMAAMLREHLEHIIGVAERNGFVVTVEQVPLMPLAMGHYKTVVSVQPARSKA